MAHFSSLFPDLKAQGFWRRSRHFWIQTSLCWKPACSWIYGPLTRVRARRNKGVQICWRGRGRGDPQASTGVTKGISLSVSSSSLFSFLFCRLSSWQVAHVQSSLSHRHSPSLVLQSRFQETSSWGCRVTAAARRQQHRSLGSKRQKNTFFSSRCYSALFCCLVFFTFELNRIPCHLLH